MNYNLTEYFNSLKFFNFPKEYFSHYKQTIISEHYFNASELVAACVVDKNLVTILSFWKSSVHNLFSDVDFTKSYKIFGKIFYLKDIKKLLTITRLKTINQFTDCLKCASKNKLTMPHHRMGFTGTLKGQNGSGNKTKINEISTSNLKGFNIKQGKV